MTIEITTKTISSRYENAVLLEIVDGQLNIITDSEAVNFPVNEIVTLRAE